MALMVPGTSALSSLLEAFVEMSGARGKCDYLDYDYDTIEARRWIAEIKIPEFSVHPHSRDISLCSQDKA